MTRHPPPEPTAGRRVLVVPSREDLVDAAMLGVLLVLALVGFRTSYSGVDYLVAGVVGLLLGLLIAHLANVLRQPMIAVAAMSIAVFFLLGGAVALRSTAIAGILPSGSTLHGLADESVHGWKDLLTTLPPVDGSGPLLVLPYILGLLGGAGGLCLARRVSQPLAAVFAPFAVLVMVILLGGASPAARLVQGAVFGVVALAWVAIRSQRLRPIISSGSGRLARLGTIAALLAVAAAGSALLGPHLPGTGDHRRLVLRSYVDPPFDIGQYPSPLAGFRKYTPVPPGNKNKAVLFTVTGLPSGTPVRIAALDSYDGLTWRASNRTGMTGGPPATFQRVGSTINDPARGRTVHFSVQLAAGYQDGNRQAPSDVWLPDVGALTHLDFRGPDAAMLARYFRYNLATGTGIYPLGLTGKDSYDATAVLPSVRSLSPKDALTATAPLESGSFVKSQAAAWEGSGSTAAQVLNIATRLRAVGRYTNGEKQNAIYLPGHYRDRLSRFLGGPQVAGDDEQFAAAYALLVNQLGVASRVVFGAIPENSGVVKGADVHAWVEVQLGNGTWRAIQTDQFMNKDKTPDKQQLQQQQQQAGKIVPPPSRGRPHSDLDDASNAVSRSTRKTATHHHAAASSTAGLPAWVATTARAVGVPLLVLALLCGVVVAAKSERRRRRRTRGTPATRLERGWREVLDHARDLGTHRPGPGTRREQAALLATPDATGLARLADAHIFGPSDPADGDAAGYWQEVERARRAMSRSVGRRRRIRGALSLSSFLHRPAPGGAS